MFGWLKKNKQPASHAFNGSAQSPNWPEPPQSHYLSGERIPRAKVKYEDTTIRKAIDQPLTTGVIVQKALMPDGKPALIEKSGVASFQERGLFVCGMDYNGTCIVMFPSSEVQTAHVEVKREG